jgi:hypothetical protein
MTLGPPIPGVGNELAEQPQLDLVPPHGECANSVGPDTSEDVNASNSPGVHCHGFKPVNSTNRRTSRNRGSTVSGRRNLARC